MNTSIYKTPVAVLTYFQGSNRVRRNRKKKKLKSSVTNVKKSNVMEKTAGASQTNIVKIGDFSIYEESVTDEGPSEKDSSRDQNIPDKLKTVIKNVEQENSKKNVSLGCLICNKGKLNSNYVLKFKTLDEFFIYLEYELKKYPEETNKEVAKNWEDYRNLKTHLNESYDNNIEYNFKSHRYICKTCFTSLIIQAGGFHRIFKTLNVNTRVLKNNCIQRRMEVEGSENTNPNVGSNELDESDKQRETPQEDVHSKSEKNGKDN